MTWLAEHGQQYDAYFVGSTRRTLKDTSYVIGETSAAMDRFICTPIVCCDFDVVLQLSSKRRVRPDQ